MASSNWESAKVKSSKDQSGYLVEEQTPQPKTDLDETVEHLITRVAKGAGIAFVGRVTGTGLKYLTQMVIARLLGAELFGLYALGIVVYRLGELFSGMGLQAGIVRYVSIHHSTGDLRRLKGVLWQAFGLPFLGGLVLGAMLFLVSGPIARDVFGKPGLATVLRIFAIALPFGATMAVAALATTGFQMTKYLVYIRELLQPFTNLLLVALLCSMGLKLYGAAVAWVLAVILSLIAAVNSVRRIFPRLIRENIKPIFEGKKLLKFSMPLALGDFFWFVLLWTDTLMLGYFRPASEVGIYRAASQTALLLIIFLTSLNTIFAPMIANLFSKGDRQRMGQLFRIAARWSFSLTLPLFLIIAIAGQDILRIFGPGFAIAWLPLIILAAGQLVNAGAGGVGYMITMSGHQYLKLLGDLAVAIINVVLNIVLIPQWGLLGAASATAISIIGVNLLRVAQVYVTLEVQAYSWVYLKVIGAGALAVLSGLAMRHWLPPVHFLLSLVVTAGVVLFVYIAALWAMRVEEEDKMILRKFQQRLGSLKA